MIGCSTMFQSRAAPTDNVLHRRLSSSRLQAPNLCQEGLRAILPAVSEHDVVGRFHHDGISNAEIPGGLPRTLAVDNEIVAGGHHQQFGWQPLDEQLLDGSRPARSRRSMVAAESRAKYPW